MPIRGNSIISDSRVIYTPGTGWLSQDGRLVLDMRAFDRLFTRSQQHKRRLIDRLLRLYLEQTPGLVDEINIAFANNHHETIRHVAHTLKSSSMAIGAVAMTDMCLQIEVSDKSTRVSENQIFEVNRAYAELEQVLHTILLENDRKPVVD